MKFLLVTLGSIGDLMPFLALADFLRQRNHVAIIASHAGYASLVRGSGFEFAIVSKRPPQALDDLIETDPGKAWQVVRRELFVPAAQPVRDFIVHHAHKGPCRVIASWNAFGALLAQKELGIPLLRVYLSPHALAEDDPSGNRVGFFPNWFAPDVSDVRTTGFPMLEEQLVPALPEALEDFLRQGSDPILFTPGSFMRRAGDFFQQARAVCARLGLRAIFLTPYIDQVPKDLPATVRHFRFISLQRLAPRAAALVHHGGIGTCAQGLRAGIPQLIKPVFFDQNDNAARIETLGVGQRITANREDELAERLSTLLTSSSVHDRCNSIRQRFDGPNALAEICDMAEGCA